MKIRKLTPEDYAKVSALLRQAFPGSSYEVQVVENLRTNGKAVHEWVCVHTNTIIAYLAFTRAYHGSAVCGLHLAPLAVKPEFQKQGIESELLRFALRQEEIKANTIFVSGDPGFFKQFGFAPCVMPLCPFAKDNGRFLSLGNQTSAPFTVRYEAEFLPGRKQGGKPRPGF
ncbi:MAG: N-acetyltransferase [Desulfobulbaceae bacterium]|nr:N-acetyltransferase [Desulfobulbaceae bacterium]